MPLPSIPPGGTSGFCPAHIPDANRGHRPRTRAPRILAGGWFAKSRFPTKNRATVPSGPGLLWASLSRKRPRKAM
jgi:hypothetical protein